MKKREISFAVALVVILVLGIILAFRSCSGKTERPEETEMPTETVEVTVATEVATEPTEVTTEPTVTETSEPTEAVPEVTQPVSTPKPGNSANTSISTGGNENSNSNIPASTTPPATVPTPTEPKATEPVATEAPSVKPSITPTEPEVIEPAPTEHTHSWQVVYHEEVSHDVPWVTCTCGARFATQDEWSMHSASFFGSGDEVMNHLSWGKTYETVVDTPAYSTWVCACGATSDTQP